MCDSLGAMREGCHPFIFYHRVRPFLSAWKHNPTLPLGVIYEGVSKERQQVKTYDWITSSIAIKYFKSIFAHVKSFESTPLELHLPRSVLRRLRSSEYTFAVLRYRLVLLVI